MTEPLTYRLDYRFPIAVVRLSGQLTPAAATVARAAITESLLEEPTSVIVDLAGLTAVDEVAVQVFAGIAAHAADWPGASLLLCAPPGPVATALRRADDPLLPIYAGFDEALAAAAADPVPRRARQRLAPTVDAPREARELVADTCDEWGLPEAAIAAEIIASELVTNAVRHAGTAIDLRMTLRDHQLRVSVHDRDRQPARLQTPGEADDHGRGLLIVEAVATSWGNVPVADGKVVWASVPVPPAHTGDLVSVGTETE
jgi:anti-sigma regulatory factor (Ser/Thr protein kinase)/anti-anti-sigma regulatory factor